MEIVCRSSGIVAAEYPRQGIGDMAKAGFGEMMLDLSSYCMKQDLEDFGKDKKKRKSAEVLTNISLLGSMVQKAAEHCRQCGLGVTSMYGPVLRRDTKREDLNALLEKLTEEGIRLCGRQKAAYLVVPPLFAGVEKDDLWKVNRAYYLRLAKIAGEESVGILLENQARDVHGHLARGVCSDEQEAARWVDALNDACGEERFGFCLDAGTASLCGQNMYEFVKTMGRRLKIVVLRDINGMEETALLPFTGVGRGQSKTDWLSLIRGLRETRFDGKLTLFLEDTASAFSPLLRPQLLALAKSVGEYIRWQVGLENVLAKHERRVLFGAGNMCRAYMKCYGEKYPPLFTCDNNKERWGTEFCGLEVHSPEDLKELSGEVAILICNIYYREIEQQLREMGLKNPIEYFNDEYLPSFHFDRLEDVADRA